MHIIFVDSFMILCKHTISTLIMSITLFTKKKNRICFRYFLRVNKNAILFF
jgi:hypothetical protein